MRYAVWDPSISGDAPDRMAPINSELVAILHTEIAAEAYHSSDWKKIISVCLTVILSARTISRQELTYRLEIVLVASFLNEEYRSIMKEFVKFISAWYNYLQGQVQPCQGSSIDCPEIWSFKIKPWYEILPTIPSHSGCIIGISPNPILTRPEYPGTAQATQKTSYVTQKNPIDIVINKSNVMPFACPSMPEVSKLRLEARLGMWKCFIRPVARQQIDFSIPSVAEIRTS
ncbi:hypothetical protein J6590_012303 [Homalodisca vitripennis]|nr:hypothetical protein J6590_012303 [Homalodisca vitripennis]